MMLGIMWMLIQVLVPALVAALFGYIVRRFGTEKVRRYKEELELANDLALAAVRYTEQTYYNLKGPAKLDKALAWMVEQAMAAGIKITVEQAKGLIEASLRLIKDEFGEQWAQLDKQST